MEMEILRKETLDDRKHIKNLKKRVYPKIRSQMEFYFSDSNLAKDSFLRQLIEKSPDGYVDLDVFKAFNKIKSISDDIGVISCAIASSTLLEISEDKKSVRRVNPLDLTHDFDACTIYVERLPPQTNQKWLQDKFRRFGHIAHISIPYFKTTRKIKGFAFVEFSSPEYASKACEFFKSCEEKDSGMEEKESDDETKAKKLVSRKRKHSEGSQTKEVSPKKHMKKKKSLDYSPEKPHKIFPQKPEMAEDKASVDTSKFEQQMPHRRNSKKRKRQSSESEIQHKNVHEVQKEVKNSETDICKMEEKDEVAPDIDLVTKSEEMLECKKDDNTLTSTKDTKTELMEEESCTAVKSEGKDVEPTEADGKSGHKRKRKKKNKSSGSQLRVMSKAEWKCYRNKYLTLQRETFSYLKKALMLDSQEQKENAPNAAPVKSNLQYQPSLILRIKLSDPVSNSIEIKEQIKSSVTVAYIDAPVGHSEIFLRCHSSNEAETIVNEGKLNQFGAIDILKDSEESDYWKKIESDRKVKYSSVTTHKKRGRDKIIARAEQKFKHIFFDE